MKSIGLLTIGQAPRPDGLARDVARVLGEGVAIVERGALDGLNPGQIAAMVPSDGDYPLITMLQNGSSAVIAKRHILDRLQSQIDDLETNHHVDATLLMCTGAFPAFEHHRPLVAPQDALYGVVAGLIGSGRIGAIMPLPSQVENARIKWHQMGFDDPLIGSSSPYTTDAIDETARVAGQLRRDGATILFLDCFGFNLEMKLAAREAFDGPVVLARSLAARFLAEML